MLGSLPAEGTYRTSLLPEGTQQAPLACRPSGTSSTKKVKPINKRVLIVGEFGSLNGGENSLLAIAPTLIDCGWELCAAVPGQSDFAAALESANIKVHPWSVRNSDDSRKSADEISSQLRQAITNCAPSILHFNSLSTSRIGGPIARDLNIPSLGYIRDIMKLSKKAISDLNQNDRIVAVSNATRQYHIDQGIDSQKIFTIHNGVDTNLFHPAGEASDPNPAQDIRIELRIPLESPVLMFVGQLGMRKGIDILIESFFRVAAQSSAHLLIIGQRHSQKDEAVQYHHNLIQKVNSSQYRNRVHWLGRRNDVANIMRTATMLIHPARQEPLGRVLLESAASGLPVVTTDVGGSSEILCDDENQNDETDFSESSRLNDLLIPLPSQEELSAVDFDKSTNDLKDQLSFFLATAFSQTIIELLHNPGPAAEVSKRLRQRALSGFSIKKCASQIDAHYRGLIG